MAARPGSNLMALPRLTPDSVVVFLRLNQIGDALVSTPIMAFFKEHFGCRIVVVADAQNHFIFARSPAVDHVVVYRKGPLGVPRVLRQVRAYRPTVVIDLHEKLSTTVSLLAGLLRAPYKFALRKHNAALFTHTAPDLDPAHHHIVERLGQLGALLAPVAGWPWRICYEVSAAARQKATDFLQMAFPHGGYLVGINTSPGTGARAWGVGNYQQLADALRARGLTPVVLTAPADQALVIAQFDPTRVFCSASFEEFAAVISQVRILFTPDTSAVHVAAAFGILVFGLYVAEAPGQLNWYPYGSRYAWCIAPQTIATITFTEAWAGFEGFLNELSAAAEAGGELVAGA